MAINKSEDLIQQFIEQSICLYNYTSSKNMIGNPNYNPKYSTKLGKAIDKIVKLIINSPTEMEKFIKLLDDKDLLVEYLAAEYLYPISPKKCLKIMKEFYNKTTEKIDKFTIGTKIDGILKRELFFIDTYKKLYNCEDLDLINREK